MGEGHLSGHTSAGSQKVIERVFEVKLDSLAELEVTIEVAIAE